MDRITSLLRRAATPAIVAAVVSIVLNGAMNYIVYSKIESQSRVESARFQEVIQFTSSADEFLWLGNSYIAAAARNENVSELQDQMRREILRQIRISQNLEIFFPDIGGHEIREYQEALNDFSSVLPSGTDALTMRPWVESYGLVHDRRRELTAALLGKVGIEFVAG